MKNARQQKILELIEKYDIDTQDTLILKLAEEPCEACHEIKVKGSVADIKNADGIVEIQTRAFERLLPKLKKFLGEYGHCLDAVGGI